ncbi:MAG: hypothetical protein KC414_07195 [Romboutsia sp.]|nr:hypothetical protein [Romboutsia sp.]
MFIKQFFITVYIYIECYWASILWYFNIKKDTAKIPNGYYCYIPDIEKNNNKKEDDFRYYIKPCPYYRTITRLKSGCTYLGFAGFDLLLGDQCRICGIKK